MRPKKNIAFRSLFKSRVTTVVLVLLIIGTGWILTGELARRERNRREAEALRRDIVEIEQKNQELEGILNMISDPEYLEREARSKLNLKKEGEKVFVVNANRDTESEIQMDKSETKRSTNWLNFLGFGDQ